MLYIQINFDICVFGVNFGFWVYDLSLEYDVVFNALFRSGDYLKYSKFYNVVFSAKFRLDENSNFFNLFESKFILNLIFN